MAIPPSCSTPIPGSGNGSGGIRDSPSHNRRGGGPHILDAIGAYSTICPSWRGPDIAGLIDGSEGFVGGEPHGTKFRIWNMPIVESSLPGGISVVVPVYKSEATLEPLSSR